MSELSTLQAALAPDKRARVRRGIEKESLRVQPDGALALTPHPAALGSPYLINVCLYILLFTVTSTFVYFQQAEIVRQSFTDRGMRTAFFDGRAENPFGSLGLTPPPVFPAERGWGGR